MILRLLYIVYVSQLPLNILLTFILFQVNPLLLFCGKYIVRTTSLYLKDLNQKGKFFHRYSPSYRSNPGLLSLAEHKKKDILENIGVHKTLLADCFGYFTENISQSFNCDFEAKQSCSQFCSI